MKRIFSLIYLFALSIYFFTPIVSAAPTCKDILIVFARGSSQILIQPTDPSFDRNEDPSLNEAKAFFSGVKSRIASWIGVEQINLGNLPGYNENGYRAVGAFNWPPLNVLQAEFSALEFMGGGYNQSVSDGADELRGLVEDRAITCPKQKIILGGYSQGAQVVGEALSQLSTTALSHVTFATLFGDPKLNPGARVASLVNDSLVSPWVRGDIARLQPGGVLDPRNPYVPDQLFGKVGSWCDQRDFICTGDFTKLYATKEEQGHERYDDEWMGQAVNEIAEHLLQALPAYSGAINQIQWQPKYAETRPTDAMLVIDTTGSMGSVIGLAKGQASSVAQELLAKPDNRAGVAEFRDHGSAFVARTVIGLTGNYQQLKDAIYGLQTGGGGDDPEAWYSGIMEGYKAEWRPNANKRTYFWADSQPKDPEPITALTKEMIVQRSLEIDPVQIYPIYMAAWVKTNLFPNSVRDVTYLAQQTGGRVIPLGTQYNSNPLGGLIALIRQASKDPVAFIDGPLEGKTNETLTFAGNASFDSDASITQYMWDFNNDRVDDLVSSNPRAIWRYDTPYNGLVLLKIKSSDGGTSSASYTIEIAKPVPTQTQTVETNQDNPEQQPLEDDKDIILSQPTFSLASTPPTVLGASTSVALFENYQQAVTDAAGGSDLQQTQENTQNTNAEPIQSSDNPQQADTKTPESLANEFDSINKQYIAQNNASRIWLRVIGVGLIITVCTGVFLVFYQQAKKRN